MNALISVSDKTGLAELARGLLNLGFRIVSTGGTARSLREFGIPVTEVAELTGYPEMLDGRVKTLHPAVHAGLLAQQNSPIHMQALKDQGIDTIDLLVVNLYPFEAAVKKNECTLAEAIENIDIGGPAMVRSAAKNWQHVAVLTDPVQYANVLAELQNSSCCKLSNSTRFALAVAAFNRVSQYDGAISNYLSRIATSPISVSILENNSSEPVQALFPEQLNSFYKKVQDLRYGENPHQKAALYQDLHPVAGSLVTALQLQGKELSYNNIADSDAAWECVKSFDPSAVGAACVIVKHANPCGVALGVSALEAYEKALSTDPTSAFGGIIAFNSPINLREALSISKQFVEVLIAPFFSAEALHFFKVKPNLRILQIDWHEAQNVFDIKRVGSGLLVQTTDNHTTVANKLTVVSKKKPTLSQLKDLIFAWNVAKFVKSNAIVFCAEGKTLGIGAGQMSRIDSAKIASVKSKNAGLSLKGSSVASDAFFPFRDGLDVVIDAGATCIIQPGGSMRDAEVIAAANEREAVMVVTGIRHFRH